MQLKQQVLVPVAYPVHETVSCPVHNLTSPRDVQSVSWHSVSWHIRELSSYRRTR